jgi:hypothetical protein
MPTLELIGFAPDRAQGVRDECRRRLADADFRQDIVFVSELGPGREVIAWSGESLPFVRVSSRSAERLDAIVTALRPLTDVETVLIGFYPRATGDGS